MPRPLAKILTLFALALFLGAGGVFGSGVLEVRAQLTTDSLDEVGDQTGLSNEDPRIIVAKLINTGLTVLGVIAVLIVLYGGFIWMTSRGSAEQIEKARKILINGFIGLFIILASWGITTFVIRSLLSATNGTIGSSSDNNGGGGTLGGGSASRSFAIEDYSPEGEVLIRNIVLRVTFTHPVDKDTVNGNLVVTNAASGSAVEGTFEVLSDSVRFTPTAACPSPNTDRFCFDENTTFNVSVSEDVKNTSGKALQCSDLAPCTSTFTSGSLIDVEDPTAEFTYPDDGDGVPSASISILQVTATDDTQLSGSDFELEGVVFDSVSAPDIASANLVFETLWDTAQLEDGQRYRVTAVVSDIAGNQTEDSIRVVARPATCFNGELDAGLGEEDVDCGGDSSSASYCGACDGGSCTENSDCSSGSCENGVCVESPEISDLTPEDGAVGTYVTISGSGFGTLEGTVNFTAEDGVSLVEAEVLDCGDGDGWSDDEIVVAVPTGAGDGPVTVTTRTDVTDRTDDEAGQLVSDFDVNTTAHPGICTLSPKDGEANDAFTVRGINFGNAQGESSLAVGPLEVGSYTSWADDGINATVPALEDGEYDVAVSVNGELSNAVSFEVFSSAGNAVITTLDPSSGGLGQYVTVSGSGFGTSTGTVVFENVSTGETAIGSVDFPSQCSDDVWSESEVTIIVPETFNDADSTGLSEGEYKLTVRTSKGVISNEADFTVNNSDPTPGICALDPANGEAGDTVNIYGDNFGNSGSVDFYSGASATASVWRTGQITVTVPSAASSGPVKVTSSGGVESNGSTFTVGDAESTTSSGRAAYAWSFSTGEIPETPEVVEACNDTQVSAVPNSSFSEASEVCTNAVVYAEFTTLMDEASVEDAVTVEACTASVTNDNDDPCSTTEEMTGSAVASSNSSFSTVTWTPSAGFSVSSTYRVTIDSTARSLDDMALARDVSWDFTTRNTTTACVIEKVIVSPAVETLTAVNTTAGFEALPVTGCVVTDSSDYTWEWDLDTYSYADFNATADDDCTGDPSACATVEALAEGEVSVEATASDSDITGTSDLTINFSDPFITDYQPDCVEACVNAEVGASFNTAMTAAEVASQDNIKLYRCANELCTDLTLDSGAIPECVLEDYAQDGTADDCLGFLFGDATLSASKFYRVVVSGSITSTSGVPLIRTNYGTDFSWTFRVREDEALCVVERLALSPSEVIVDAIGESTPFTALAYGEADSCSTSGQQLSGSEFDWSWTDPIVDNPDNETAYSVAEWAKSSSSELFDSDFSTIPRGCTSLCTASGSEPEQAVCGNNSLERDTDTSAGEDCDDGNTLDDDGCSSSCKYEGTQSDCGNSKIDSFEDCDDGNALSGDGCSSSCTAEGSSSIGTMCGNNDIAFDTTTLAGEECDDGNALSGDGCSRDCLREGSSTQSEIGSAQCGDGNVTEPYETCDDENVTDGDGCSSTCLREGRYVDSFGGASICGNRETESDRATLAGEDCDSQEGCTDDCVWAGSSAAYTAPSFCGDGEVGTGEIAACENGTSGDGLVDDTQVATISDDASFEVSSVTNTAGSTIQVSTAGLSVTADLTLMCVAQDDQDCSDPALYGVGVSNCCFERPKVELDSLGSNVCLNATLFAGFSEEMALESFTSTETSGSSTVERAQMYAKLSLAAGQSCPITHTTIAHAPSSFALRLWNSVKAFFMGSNVSADQGDCILPIHSYTQTAQDDGTYKVSIRTTELMQSNSTYTLVVEGDDDVTDVTSGGVRSARDVGLNGTETLEFTTGDEICTLDALEIEDSDSDSPYVFTSTGETHAYVATPISYTSGKAQEISPVAGAYDWTYSDWSSNDTTVFKAAILGASTPEQGTVSTVGINGDASIAITATVTTGGTGAVSGTADVTAYLCENPWPALASFPWSDDATGKANGLAEEGTNGFMNFSTSYCRDSGELSDTSDDLTAVSVVMPPSLPADEVIKEYLFEMEDGSGDAIGVRIVSNANYSSPMAWYEEQDFIGSPSETTVDGFPAVQDGRTVYVGASNDSGSAVYPNIYVISYNEGASQETVDIYDMMLANMEFVINVADDRFCYESGAIVLDSNGNPVTCSSDLNCDVSAAQACGSDKLKLTRDMERLGELNDIAIALELYGEANSTCSDTTSQTCSEDSDCSDDETCEIVVPTLPSGTYVSSLASSAWGSWEEIFGGALDGSDISSDPLNDYSSCGVVGSVYESYNSETCVNQTTGAYACPEDSYVYHYRAIGSRAYELAATIEYDEHAWYGDVDADTSDDFDVHVGTSGSADSLCDGDKYGVSTTCGDGLIGGSEQCEIGDTQGVSCDTDSSVDTDGDGTKDNDENGTVNQVCKSDCSDYENVDGATCEANECGNGVIEGLEQCDDGAYNGRYGYCGTSCTYASGSYCGDGEVSGSEACDCGDTSVPADARPYGGTAGNCIGVNGTYGANVNTTCAWDCSGPAAYCGDSEVDSGEQCDGDGTSWAGELCYGGDNAGEACEDDNDCTGGVCGETSQCRLESTVLCDGTNDSTTCGNWGTCEATESTVLGYACVIPTYDGRSFVTCDGYDDTKTCDDGMQCVGRGSEGSTSITSYICATVDSTNTCGGFSEGDDETCITETESGDALCASNSSGYSLYKCVEKEIECTSDATCASYASQLGCHEMGVCKMTMDYECTSATDAVCTGWGGTCVETADGFQCSIEETACDAVSDADCSDTYGNSAPVTCDTSLDDAYAACELDERSYQTYRTHSCDALLCEWTPSGESLLGEECLATDACGDGVANVGEECDDGNDTNTDGCTNACTANVCGDGYLYESEEQCDEGVENGDGCEASYGSSCSSCSVSCRYESGSGEFCGDGEVNGDEFCDGNDMPYYYLSSSFLSSGIDDDATIYGTCTTSGSSFVDDQSTSDSSDDVLYICQSIGMCSGDDDNGNYCASDSDCDSDECLMPTCNANCASSCPFTTSSASLEITSNEAGADPESSVSLYTYSATDGADLPNAAVLTIPSCSAATEIVADVSYDGVTQPEVDVVFVTDLSGGMTHTLGSSTRLEVAQESIIAALDELYDDLETVEVALLSFAGPYNGGVSVYTDGTQQWFDSNYKADLETAVMAYSPGGDTYTADALEEAKDLLDNRLGGARKIIILLSEGEPEEDQDPAEIVANILSPEKLGEEGYELYSLALSTDTDFIKDMNRWSSNSKVTSLRSLLPSTYNKDNYIDYSYSGDTAEELEDAYSDVVQSVVFGNVALIATDDQGTDSTSDDVTYVTSGRLEGGSNVVLPWPEGFRCDSSDETDIPVRITFSGEGQVEISNLSINYCAP